MKAGQPATEARAGTRVVAVIEAPWERAVWAKLDNGLQLLIEHDEGPPPVLLLDRDGWRRLNIIGQVSILLGLPVPPYGVGGFA